MNAGHMDTYSPIGIKIVQAVLLYVHKGNSSLLLSLPAVRLKGK